jgi:hypothetical protein
MFQTYTIQFNTSICRFWVIQMAEIIHTFYFSKSKSVFQSMSCPTRNQGLRFCRTYIFPIRRKWCMFGYASFERFRYCRTYIRTSVHPYTRSPAHPFTDSKNKRIRRQYGHCLFVMRKSIMIYSRNVIQLIG